MLYRWKYKRKNRFHAQPTMLKFKSPFIEGDIESVELRKDLKWVKELNKEIFVKLHEAVENGPRGLHQLKTKSDELDQNLSQFIDHLKTLPNIRQSITYMDPDFPDYLKGFETQEREKIEGLKSTIERGKQELEGNQETLDKKKVEITQLFQLNPTSGTLSAID